MEKEIYFLTIEDLFYLMITTLRQHNIHPNRFSYHELKDYGNEIVKIGKEKGICFCLSLSRDETTKFLNDHSDLIKEDTVYVGYHGIKLTRRLSNDEIKDEFCSYFPLSPLLTIFDENFTKKIAYKYKIEHGLIMSNEEPMYQNRTAALNFGDLFCCMALNLYDEMYVDKISFEDLDKYGKLLVKFAKQEKIDVTLNLSLTDTKRFLLENDVEVFGMYFDSEEASLIFKRPVLKSEIEHNFLKYLRYYVKDLIIDPKFVKKVLSMYKKEHESNGYQRTRIIKEEGL